MFQLFSGELTMNSATEAEVTTVTKEIVHGSNVEIVRTPRRSLRWKVTNAIRYVLPYPQKLINYAGLQYSLYTGKFDHHFYPVKLGIEVTGRCNLSCPLCSRTVPNRRPQGDMKLEDFKKIIDKLSPYLFAVRLHNYGEPMLHPQLSQMITYAHKKGIYTNFHTNGHFLNQKNVEDILCSGLDEINIALDGMSQITYSYYRVGGNFQTVVDGITLLCKRKRDKKLKKPRINLQFVIMAHNEHEIPKVTSFSENVGADCLYLKPVYIYTGKDSGNRTYLPKKSAFNVFVEKNGTMKVVKKCRRTFFETIINWDGTISICSYDYLPEHFVSGNVFKDGIDKVLFGDEFAKIREISYNMGHEVCKNCMDNHCQV